jgi:hypothetical protein
LFVDAACVYPEVTKAFLGSPLLAELKLAKSNTRKVAFAYRSAFTIHQFLKRDLISGRTPSVRKDAIEWLVI